MTTTIDDTISDKDRDDFSGPGETSLWMAAYRARESRRPDRLYNDPYAELLAGKLGPKLLTHFHNVHASDEGNPYLAIRTRWFDDYIARNVTAGTQAVGLGAGLDARAFRLDWAEDTTYYEVDQAAVLAHKADKLDSVGAVPKGNRVTIPVDLADDWVGALRAAGHDPSVKTTWFAEGVLFYLPQEGAADVLRKAAELSAPGSEIAVDLVGPGIFTFPYAREFLRRLEASGAPWRWGTLDLVPMFEAAGWSDVEVLEPGNEGANYGRWPEHASPKNIPGIPRIFLVRGVKK